MGKYPYASTSDHTELQWLNSGYVIKRGRKGIEKYTSGSSQHTAIYYGESDVRKDEEKAAAAGAAPSVTFEAAEGEALNITGKENNPMVNQLVEAIENQEQEREP